MGGLKPTIVDMPTRASLKDKSMSRLFQMVISKFLFIPILITYAFSAHGEEATFHNPEEMIQALKLEKKQVETMVDKLVKSGRMSPEDGDKVRREIASVKESDIEQIKNESTHQFARKNN